MKRWKRFESIVIIIFFVILLGFLIDVSLSAPLHRVGDSSTYYLQISSIAEDFDIQYQPVDIQRALSNKFDDLPKGLILIKTDEGSYYYGKEYSYALFASPFFILLSNHGILFFNALMFFLMILMGFFYLRKKGNSPILSFFTSLVFFLLSTAFVYIFWIHVEIYNMFLITAGIFFWSLYIDDQNKNQYLITAAFIFGLAAVAKLPNSLLFLPFVCYELYNRQYKKAISIVLIFLIPMISVYSFFYLETGSISFYGGNRLYYLNQYPFIENFDSVNESGRPAFSVEEGRISALISSDVLTKSPINLFYYFFGKFTGMIWYYPLTVFALISFVLGIIYLKKQSNENYTIISIISKNPIQTLVFIGIILNILFYVVLFGNNYLGGQHAIGNRYFYIFPAFLFLIGKIDLKIIIPFIIIALFTVIPIISDPIGITEYPEIHTYKFPYTIFPIEYSQINNLPIWIHQYTFPNYSIFDIDGNSKNRNNIILINGTSRWLIKSKSRIDHVDFVLGSDEIRDTRIAFESADSFTERIVNNMTNKNVDIPLYKPSYVDNGYHLYEIKIMTASEVSIRPF